MKNFPTPDSSKGPKPPETTTLEEGITIEHLNQTIYILPNITHTFTSKDNAENTVQIKYFPAFANFPATLEVQINEDQYDRDTIEIMEHLEEVFDLNLENKHRYLLVKYSDSDFTHSEKEEPEED